MISCSGGASPYKPVIGHTLRVPFDACYADSESCDSLESHSLEVGVGWGGGGGEWLMKDKIFRHYEFLSTIVGRGVA